MTSVLVSNSIVEKYLFFTFFFLIGATATDSLSAGYRTILIDDCCRGVDLQDIETTKETVLNNHGVIVSSREVEKFLFDFLFLPFFHFHKNHHMLVIENTSYPNVVFTVFPFYFK